MKEDNNFCIRCNPPPRLNVCTFYFPCECCGMTMEQHIDKSKEMWLKNALAISIKAVTGNEKS